MKAVRHNPGYRKRYLQRPILTNSRDKAELIRELELLVSDHPLFAQAKSKKYCENSELLLFTADEINRFRIDPKAKNVLMNTTKKPERKIRILNLITAEEVPEPFAGAGEHYMFFFHPRKAPAAP